MKNRPQFKTIREGSAEILFKIHYGEKPTRKNKGKVDSPENDEIEDVFYNPVQGISTRVLINVDRVQSRPFYPSD